MGTVGQIIGIGGGALRRPGAYRPSQWSNGSAATLTLTVPSTIPGKDGSPPTQTTIIYVFDAILRAEDEQRVVMTKNPVQTGATVTDHAYVLPARLTVEIGMSDAMQSFFAGQFSNGSSRSVSAYQTLRDIARSFTLCQISTRLSRYSNMLIENLQATQDSETAFGGKFYVVFEELLFATTSESQQGASARPQTTNSTVSGTTQTGPVLQAMKDQHFVTTALARTVLGPGSPVPGAGSWASTNVLNTAGALHF